jgi:predicted 3-demethylubiquinone-9 3-methyltransferase (glyoxalase superfamily)
METTISFNQKIMPYLWFNGNAKEAIDFYVNLFPRSVIERISYWPNGSNQPKGAVMNACINLCGLNLYIMDAQPATPFSQSMSLFVHCANQAELNKYYDAFMKDGATALPCGWLTDKFGLSWQLIPMQFIEYMNSGNPQITQKVMTNLMKMKKIEVDELLND